jgi:hypothetical protein
MAMKNLTVYRVVDRKKKKVVPVGTVLERRKGERGSNFVGLLRIAKKTFVSSPGDSLQIQAGNMRVDF